MVVKKKKTKAISPVSSFNLVKSKRLMAFRSSIGNLFTSSDETLSTTGYVECLSYEGYWGDVIKSLKIYESSEFIHQLIDRTVYCSNTRYDFQTKDKKLKKVLKEWSENVNGDMVSILPGLANINRWIFKSMRLTGMAVPDIEWGKMKIGKTEYELPVKMTVLPTLSVKLLSVNKLSFGTEEIWLGMNEEVEKENFQNAETDVNYTVKYVGWTKETSRDNKGSLTTTKLKKYFDDDKREDTVRGYYAVKRPNAFAIKYGWTPQDKTFYPIPPLKPFFPILAMRFKIMEAQISTLEDIITQLITVKVGDADHEPDPTLLSAAGNVISQGMVGDATKIWEEGEVQQIITMPYYMEIKRDTPDLGLLLNQDKLVATNQAILNGFGIIQDADAGSNTQNMEQVNLKTFSRQLEEYQKYVENFYDILIKKILEKNPNLTGNAKFKYDSPNVEAKNVLGIYQDLYKMGAISHKTLCEKHEIDAEEEIKRIKEQEKDRELLIAIPTFNQATEKMRNEEKGGEKDNKDKTDEKDKDKVEEQKINEGVK